MIFVELILSITKTWIYEAYRKANNPVNQKRLVNTLRNDKHFSSRPPPPPPPTFIDKQQSWYFTILKWQGDWRELGGRGEGGGGPGTIGVWGLGSQEAVNSQSNVHHNSLSTVVSDKIWPKRRTNHTQNPFVPIFTHPTFPPKSSLELPVSIGLHRRVAGLHIMVSPPKKR